MTTATLTVYAPEIWNQYEHLKGFGDIRYYGAPLDSVWGKSDKQLAEILTKAKSKQTSRLINTIAEHTPIGLMSDQDGGTFGALRFSGGSQRKLFGALAIAPEVRGTKYSAAFAAAAVYPTKLPVIDCPGLREALWVCSRQPWYLKVYFDRWRSQILDDAWASFKRLSWKSELGLALLLRARSSGRLGEVQAAALAKSASGEATQIRAGADAYAALRDLYADRVKELYQDHTMEPIGAKPDPVADLYLDARPYRQDGSAVAPYPATDTNLYKILLAVAVAVAAALLLIYGAKKMRWIK